MTGRRRLLLLLAGALAAAAPTAAEAAGRWRQDRYGSRYNWRMRRVPRRGGTGARRQAG